MKYSLDLYKPEQLGTVIEQSVCCGKANCHCSQGEKHTAYYHYYRAPDKETGKIKLIKKYVSKSQVETLKQEILERKWEILTFKIGNSRDSEFIDRFFCHLPNEKKWMIKQFPMALRTTRRELGRYMDTYPRGEGEISLLINQAENLLKQMYK